MQSDNILIVEDNEPTRHWLSELAAEIWPAAEVSLAVTVTEAMQQVTNNHFSLVILDLGLPDGSGLEVLNQIRQAGDDCLVVVATIYDDDQHVLSSLRAGANGSTT